jgi:hypothetical protein
MAGRVHVDQLSMAERGWLVAVLTARGVTTDDIAAKLRCSRRLVQQIRCEPVASVTAMMLKVECEARANARRLQEGCVEAAVAPYRAEVARLKIAHGRLVDQLAKGDCCPVVIGIPVPMVKKRPVPAPAGLCLF